MLRFSQLHAAQTSALLVIRKITNKPNTKAPWSVNHILKTKEAPFSGIYLKVRVLLQKRTQYLS